MLKLLYITFVLLFLITAILPFKNSFVSYTTPTVEAQHTKTQEIKDFFAETALLEDYTKENIINFNYHADYNKNAPVINAESAVLIDLNRKQILFAKNENQKRPIASLVKVMTAILAVEHAQLNTKVLVSEKAASIGENSMGIEAGEMYTMEELLHGLILNSGNDAAYAIAEGVGKDHNTFVDWMNKKAKLLGANNTLFVDSFGLNVDDKEYYSTAVDLAKISAYSQKKHSSLRNIYSTFIKEIAPTQDHKYLYLENQTNLLTTYPGVKGMKTGYTDEAGLCLISYAENDGQELIAVILNSTDRRGDAILLLDYGFNRLGVHVEHNLLEQ